MIITSKAEIEKLATSEIDDVSGYINIDRVDYERIQALAGEPYAAIVTDCFSDVQSLVDGLKDEINEAGAVGLKGIFVQIHTRTMTMRELASLHEALSPFENEGIKLLRGIVFEQSLADNTHKAVAFLFGK